MLASLNDSGRAAVVLDTGAASRGSGNANTNKEKDVRKWFVEQDLIEGVIYLPENLFYNTTAPGIILFLNNAKPNDRKGKLFLLNASREFAKGDPKNYLPDDAILRIADTFKSWREEDKFSRIVTREEIAKNDFNISPSRYIHTGEADEYRPIAEIVEELDALNEEDGSNGRRSEENSDRDCVNNVAATVNGAHRRRLENSAHLDEFAEISMGQSPEGNTIQREWRRHSRCSMDLRIGQKVSILQFIGRQHSTKSSTPGDILFCDRGQSRRDVMNICRQVLLLSDAGLHAVRAKSDRTELR